MNCTGKRNTKYDYKRSKLKLYVLGPYIEYVLYFIFYVNVLWLSINQATLPLSLLCNCTLTYSPLVALNCNDKEFEFEFFPL